MKSSWTDRNFTTACIALGVFGKDSPHYKDFENAILREVELKIQESGDAKVEVPDIKTGIETI